MVRLTGNGWDSVSFRRTTGEGGVLPLTDRAMFFSHAVSPPSSD